MQLIINVFAENTMTTVGLGTRHTHTVDVVSRKALLDRLSRVFMVKTEVYIV